MKKLLALLLIVTLTTSCGKKTRTMKVGESISIKTETTGTSSEYLLDVVEANANNKDAKAINSILESGNAVVLHKGMWGKIEHVRKGKVQIHLLSGREVWVLYEYIE